MRHILDAHDTAVAGGYDHLGDLFRRPEQLPRLDGHARPATHHACGGLLHIATLNGPRYRVGRQTVGVEPRGVERHTHLAGPAADERHLRHIRNLGDGLTQLRRQAPQLVVAVPLGRQCEREDRHVIDGPRLDERPGHAGRDPVRIGRHLLVEPDNGVLLGFAHLEADDHHGLPGA